METKDKYTEYSDVELLDTDACLQATGKKGSNYPEEELDQGNENVLR